jgi:hypothetical protein
MNDIGPICATPRVGTGNRPLPARDNHSPLVLDFKAGKLQPVRSISPAPTSYSEYI